MNYQWICLGKMIKHNSCWWLITLYTQIFVAEIIFQLENILRDESCRLQRSDLRSFLGEILSNQSLIPVKAEFTFTNISMNIFSGILLKPIKIWVFNNRKVVPFHVWYKGHFRVRYTSVKYGIPTVIKETAILNKTYFDAVRVDMSCTL